MVSREMEILTGPFTMSAGALIVQCTSVASVSRNLIVCSYSG